MTTRPKKTTADFLQPLSPDSLYSPCGTDDLDFESTASLPELADAFGQSRAAEAIRFGLDIGRAGGGCRNLALPHRLPPRAGPVTNNSV